MKRLREFFEKLAYAGLKPRDPRAPIAPRTGFFGRLRERADRFISGGPAPSDPLYLSNRTPAQKARAMALIAVPCFLLAVAAGIAFTVIEAPEPKPQKELSAKEIAAKVLPNFDAITLGKTADVQVAEILVKHDGGSRLEGILKNTSTHEVGVANLLIDLTDATGTQVGAVNSRVENIPAGGAKPFTIPIQRHDAAFALVREIHTN